MILGPLLAGYVFVALLLYFFQENIIFQGITLREDHLYTFQSAFEEVNFEIDDEVTINALHFKSNEPKGIIFYHHGNAGNLDRWGEIAEYFLQFQYDVLIYDYRGYGKSTGQRTEATLYSDAQFIYDQLKTTWKEEDIIVYGRSLGSGIASQLVANNSPKILILESPFYSLQSMAKDRFPIYPSGLLVKYELPNWKNLQKGDTPIVILHGTDDNVVPFDQGMNLYQSVSDKATLITIEGGDHNHLVNFPEYREGIKKILEDS